MSTLLSNADIRHMPPVPVEASIHHHEPLLYIERQARHIQRNLQVLLDAQSDGLLAGLSGHHPDDAFSNGSPTPTPSTVSHSRGAPTIPVRQPAKRKIGLRAARKGILKSMHELLNLKEEEKRILAAHLEERRNALKEVDAFVAKQHGLEETIAAIQSDRDSQRSKELKEEARSLEHEIKELEHRLYEMKARHRHVLNEISQVENSVEAKLSSYKASLAIHESKVRKYLENPPLQPLPSMSKDSFYSLNPKRRTLDMARDHWRAEQSELRKRQRGVDLEIGALQEGSVVWQDVVSEVSGFEKRLREEMRRSVETQSQLLNPSETIGNNIEEDRARAIIKDMDDTIARVEAKLTLAEEKDWKLLVCCIGAELEAFKEAKAMLLDMFNMSEDNIRPPPESDQLASKHDEHHSNAHNGPRDVDNPEPPADLLTATASSPHETATRSEDEDDEPDPAWLLSDT
ncbi:autophagy-related protein Atg28 [Thermoascus aurantiacus ATCC 26904]